MKSIWYQQLKASKTEQETEKIFREMIDLDDKKGSLLCNSLRDGKYLKEHVVTLLQCMRAQTFELEEEKETQTDEAKEKANVKRKKKRDTLYDRMIDCITLDCMMAVLNHYDKLLRLLEGRRGSVDLQQKDESGNPYWDKQSFLQRWLFPQKKAEWLSTARRKPLLKDVYGLVGKCPPDLDKEFLQALVALQAYGVTFEENKYMLHPASYIPLLSGHPYFIYSVEKHWNLYAMLCNRDLKAVDNGDKISPHLLNYYVNRASIPQLLTEWYRLFDDQYYDLILGSYSVTKQGKFFDCFNEILNAWCTYQQNMEQTTEDKQERKEQLSDEEPHKGPNECDDCGDGKDLYEKELEEAWCALLDNWLANADHCFQGPTAQKRLAQLIAAPESSERVQKKLAINPNLIAAYCQELQSILENSFKTKDVEPVYVFLSELFNGVTRMKTSLDEICAKSETTSTKKEVKKIRSAVKHIMIQCSQNKQDDQNDEVWKSLLQLNIELADITLQHLDSKKWREDQLLWYEREGELVIDQGKPLPMQNFVTYEPSDFIQAPCTKMFFVRLQKQIWPDLAGTDGQVKWQKEEKVDTEDNFEVCTNASYYIGACVLSRILDKFYNKLLRLLERMEAESATWKDGQIEGELTWRWAKCVLHHERAQDDKNPDTVQYDVSGKTMQLLQKLMSWFYTEELLEQAVHTCQYVKLCVYSLSRKENYFTGNQKLCELLCNYMAYKLFDDGIEVEAKEPKDIIEDAKKYWEDIQKCETEQYVAFLRMQMYLTANPQFSVM